jgi:HAD superfamily hydrolase (TIGR01509 family)
MSLAVIFDMDGLMLDTERIARNAWKRASDELGCPVGEDVYDRMVGLNVRSCKELLRARYGSPFPVDELELTASAIYYEYLRQGIPLKPGLLELIRYLEDCGIPRAVATSTATDLARDKLRMAGVLDHFQFIVGGDQVSNGKPNPDIYLLAAVRLQHSPQDCLALEDSEPGVRAAAAAGMQTILVPERMPPTPDALSAARYVVSSLSAAIPLIQDLLDHKDGPSPIP